MKNTQNLIVFVKISHFFAFLPIELLDFVETNNTLAFKQIFSIEGKRKQKNMNQKDQILIKVPLYISVEKLPDCRPFKLYKFLSRRDSFVP